MRKKPEIKERDTFVALLKMLKDGWNAQYELIDSQGNYEDREELMQLQVLIAKANKFLREEFGE